MRVLLTVLVFASCGKANAPQPIDTHFDCGALKCDARTEYCELEKSGTCKALPTSCAASTDCKCFPQDTPCSTLGMCDAKPAGDRMGLTLHCPNL